MAQSPSPKKKPASSIEKENSSVAVSSSDVTLEDETSRDVTSSTDTPTTSNFEAASTSSIDGPRVLLRKIDTNLFGRDALTNSVERKMKFSPLTSRGLVALTTSPIVDKKERSIRPKHRKVNKRLYTDDDVGEQL